MSGALRKLLRPLGLGGFAIAVALLTGCAQIKLGNAVASVDNIQKAKASGMGPVAVGEFALGSGRPKALDEGIGLRSNTVSSPYQGSFAQYLKETLSVELKGAGLLDPASKTVVQGWLTDSQLDAAVGEGTGSVAARFVVLRAGKSVYDKELKASARWESSFVGAIAIPAAVNQYSGLYRQLVSQLLDDASFRAAVRQ
jgi:hypothetical protein